MLASNQKLLLLILYIICTITLSSNVNQVHREQHWSSSRKTKYYKQIA